MKIKNVIEVNDKLTTVLLEGTGTWLSILKPKTKYDGEGTEYSANIDATDSDVEELNTRTGLTRELKYPKSGEGSGFLTFKANGEFADGNPTPPISVFDSNMQPVTEEVGNGSKVRLQVNITPYTFKKKTGLSARLVAVQVLEHIPFARRGVNLDLFDSIESEQPKVLR
jgi:hypothetical protein